VGAISFLKYVDPGEIYITNVAEIRQILNNYQRVKYALFYNKEVLKQKVTELVPSDYYDYLNVFSKAESNTLALFHLGY